MSEGAPKRLGSSLAKVVAARAPQTLLAEVQMAWPEVAGPQISANAEPVSERDGAVTIACATGPWSQELEMIGDTLLERLSGALGEGRIERLRFTADLARHR